MDGVGGAGLFFVDDAECYVGEIAERLGGLGGGFVAFGHVRDSLDEMQYTSIRSILVVLCRKYFTGASGWAGIAIRSILQ